MILGMRSKDWSAMILTLTIVAQPQLSFAKRFSSSSGSSSSTYSSPKVTYRAAPAPETPRQSPRQKPAYEVKQHPSGGQTEIWRDQSGQKVATRVTDNKGQMLSQNHYHNDPVTGRPAVTVQYASGKTITYDRHDPRIYRAQTADGRTVVSSVKTTADGRSIREVRESGPNNQTITRSYVYHQTNYNGRSYDVYEPRSTTTVYIERDPVLANPWFWAYLSEQAANSGTQSVTNVTVASQPLTDQERLSSKNTLDQITGEIYKSYAKDLVAVSSPPFYKRWWNTAQSWWTHQPVQNEIVVPANMNHKTSISGVLDVALQSIETKQPISVANLFDSTGKAVNDKMELIVPTMYESRYDEQGTELQLETCDLVPGQVVKPLSYVKADGDDDEVIVQVTVSSPEADDEATICHSDKTVRMKAKNFTASLNRFLEKLDDAFDKK